MTLKQKTSWNESLETQMMNGLESRSRVNTKIYIYGGEKK